MQLWKRLRENMKVSAKENLAYKEPKENKTWLYEE
jgi:hypothetical protein